MLALVTFMRLVLLVWKTLTVSGVVVLMLLAKTSETLAACLNTLAHVAITMIADLVSPMSTKDVYGVIMKEPDFAKSQTLLALSL